jgi:hypothetical protein
VAEEVGRHCLAHDAQAQEPHLHLCCLLPPSPALFSPKLASAHGTPWQAPSRPMLDFLYVFMGFFLVASRWIFCCCVVPRSTERECRRRRSPPSTGHRTVSGRARGPGEQIGSGRGPRVSGDWARLVVLARVCRGHQTDLPATSAGCGRTARAEVPLLYVPRVSWACSKPIGLLLFFTWASTSLLELLRTFHSSLGTRAKSIAATEDFF